MNSDFFTTWFERWRARPVKDEKEISEEVEKEFPGTDEAQVEAE